MTTKNNLKNGSEKSMKKRYILMSLSVLFLVNPVFGIADYVPDFPGYILLCIGLSGLAKLEDNLGAARKDFLTLLYVTAGKFALWLTFPSLPAMTKLLLSFSFAVVEAIFFLPAFSKLFSGLDYLLSRHSDGDFSAKPQKLKGITYAFFIVKSIASFAPLLPTLSVSGIGDGGTFVYGSGETVWAQFTGLFNIFGAVLTLAFALPWAFSFIKMNLAICKNGAFMASVSEKYEREVLSFPNRIAAERLKTAMLLFTVSCGFTANFYIDYVNVLPGFISALLLFAAVLYLREAPAALRVSCAAISVGRSVLSYVGLVLQRNFVYEGYTPERALHGIGDSAEMYAKIEAFSYAEGLLYGICAVLFMLCVLKTVKAYGEKLPRVADAVRSVRLRMIPVGVFLAISVAADVVKAPVTKYFAAFYAVGIVIAAALVIFAYRAYLEATENLGNRMSL